MTNPAFGRSSNRQQNVRRVLCGQTFSEYKVEAHTPARSRRVPRRSARARFAQHRIESAMAMDPANDNGLPRELVWGMPWRGDTSFVRTRYCVGGKSVYCGGWCPKLIDGDLAVAPPHVARYLKRREIA